MQIAIVLGLLVLAVVLFSLEVVSVDVITLLLLTALVLTGVLSPSEAFSGFSSDIIVIIASIFVISGALQQNGVMDAIGSRIHRISGGSYNGLLLAFMAAVGSVSAFMNNTTATAIFVPPAIGVARQAKMSPSKLLLPIAFGSILGGTCTLIGTSTNVAVSGYLAKLGMKPLGLFEFTPIGLLILIIGVVYMLTVGKRLLPDHKDESLTEEYAIREYLSEIIIPPESHLIGQRIFESDLAKHDFRILEVLRGNEKFLPTARTTINKGDVLLVEGKVNDLIKIKDAAGIEIKADLTLGDKDLQAEDIKIAEALVPPQSELVGRTLKEVNFRRRYGLVALAIYRHGQSLRDKIGHIRLRVGDLLLVQGPPDRFSDLRRSQDLWVLEEISPQLYRKRKGAYTVLFFAAAILLGGFDIMPLSIAMLAAALLILLFGCISIEDAYEFIEWKLIILIGGMTAFGTAMQKSGAAEFLAKHIVAGLGPIASRMPGDYGIILILASFVVLTILITLPMSNAAAALVVLPVALETAERLSVNDRTFAIAIMLAASLSFMTPLEPSCILVYGPGKYRFADFIKVGLGLTLILSLAIVFLVPKFWPLRS